MTRFVEDLFSQAPAGIHLMSLFVQYAPYRLAGDQAWADIRVAA